MYRRTPAEGLMGNRIDSDRTIEILGATMTAARHAPESHPSGIFHDAVDDFVSTTKQRNAEPNGGGHDSTIGLVVLLSETVPVADTPGPKLGIRLDQIWSGPNDLGLVTRVRHSA